MKKEVVITQTGFQYLVQGENAQPIETVSPGEYYFRNGNHYLLFDETTEGFDQPTHTMMKFNGERLLLHKRGLISVEMLFEKGKNTSTYYEMPFGRIAVGVTATHFWLKERLDEISYQVDYALSLDGNFVADCQIHIKVQPRMAGTFTLMQ